MTADPRCPVCAEPLDGHGQALDRAEPVCPGCWPLLVTALRNRRPERRPTPTTVAATTGPTTTTVAAEGAAGPATAPPGPGGGVPDGAVAEVAHGGTHGHSVSPSAPTLGAKR